QHALGGCCPLCRRRCFRDRLGGHSSGSFSFLNPPYYYSSSKFRAAGRICATIGHVETLGRRERKKLQTRQLLADTARRLFAERGFEAVSVAEVAREADVAEATVFNYFPTKEDLVYSGLESFENELLAAIRDRPSGETILQAFGRFVREPRGYLAARDRQSAQRLLEISRMIAQSPALLAREQQVFARYTASRTTFIANEAGPTDAHPRP